MDSIRIRAQMKEFILFGPKDVQNLSNERVSLYQLTAMKSTVEVFRNDWKCNQDEMLAHLNKMEQLKRSIEIKITESCENEVLANLNNYKRKKARIYIQFNNFTIRILYLQLYVGIEQIRYYKDVRLIPELVLSICANTPSLLFGQSRIRAVLMQIVKELKSKLLAKFHSLFEAHLTDAQQRDARMDTGRGSSDESIINSESWSAFLRGAKDWLLAYSLVSLLPTVLAAGESRTRMVEVYQAALDEAFTPVWGRFHYHLEVARAARSWQHVVWTFSYSKSFAQMLADLSNQMTASGQLQRLCNIDYRAAGLLHVADKAIKFLRAHVAQVLVDFSPLSGGICGQLAEECLEVDQVLRAIAPESSSLCGGSAGVSSVLFDSKEAFHQWLALEHAYFSAALLANCATCAVAYRFEFGAEPPSSSGAAPLRCYQAVHSCLSLFSVGCERYRHLPAAAQSVLSEIILEPLLCVVAGLFLYRIRSHAVMYAISCGEYKHSKQAGGAAAALWDDGRSSALPEPLQEFRDCAAYLQRVLLHNSGVGLRASSGRMRRRWSEVQTWVPKTLLLDGSSATHKLASVESGAGVAGLTGYGVRDMVVRALSLPEVFSAQQADGGRLYEYRAHDGKASQDCAADCCDLLSGLVETLDTVMLKQFRKS